MSSPGTDQQRGGIEKSDAVERLSKTDHAAFTHLSNQFHQIVQDLDQVQSQVNVLSRPENLRLLDPAVSAAVRELGAMIQAARDQAAAATVEFRVSNAWPPDRDGIRAVLRRVFGLPALPAPGHSSPNPNPVAPQRKA